MSSVLCEMVSETERYVPEAVAFLRSVLLVAGSMSVPTSKKQSQSSWDSEEEWLPAFRLLAQKSGVALKLTGKQYVVLGQCCHFSH